MITKLYTNKTTALNTFNFKAVLLKFIAFTFSTGQEATQKKATVHNLHQNIEFNTKIL